MQVASLWIHYMIKKQQLEENLWLQIQTDNSMFMEDKGNILCSI